MFYNKASSNSMNDFSSSMEEDSSSNMNLLISPFEPDPIQLGYADNYNTTISNNNSNLDLYRNSELSPNAMSNTTSYDMLTNELISRSPESSSSADSNLVSPPHQYFLCPETMAQPLQHNNHHKRSASVPPHFQKFKPHFQDGMYNQFQVTQQPQQQEQMPMTPKPLPIQIQRVSAQNASTLKTVDSESRRRQLDERLEKVNFDDITVAELKEMLRERGLSATGRKAELMHRLKEEYKLLMKRGGAAAVAASGVPAISVPSLIQRRMANMNIVDSPKRQQQQSRLYAPYSPPVRQSSIPVAHRLASSVPESVTRSYLNDQFMMRKPSTLHKSMDEREWIQPLSASPPSKGFYPSVPKIDESANISSDVWDDQTLQTFLSQI